MQQLFTGKGWIVLSLAALLSACSTNPADNTDGAASVDASDNDPAMGAWVRNIPGQPHTHHVVLPGCGAQTFTHVHLGNQVGAGLHKHDGCLVCPPKKAGVKRILQ